jgi:hypothetical protein
MTITAVESERRWFERTVAETAHRPSTRDAIGVELDRQLAFQPNPHQGGLDELAGQVARWLDGERRPGPVAALTARYPAQPLVHYYSYAMRREAGDFVAARQSIVALLTLDPWRSAGRPACRGSGRTPRSRGE